MFAAYMLGSVYTTERICIWYTGRSPCGLLSFNDFTQPSFWSAQNPLLDKLCGYISALLQSNRPDNGVETLDGNGGLTRSVQVRTLLPCQTLRTTLNPARLTSAGFHRIAPAKPDSLIIGISTSSSMRLSMLFRVTASRFR